MDFTDPEIKLQLVAAAAPSVGPDEYDEDDRLLGDPYEVRLTKRVGDIVMMVNSDSNPLSKMLGAFSRNKPFRTTITGVEKEKSTGRGIIYFTSPPTSNNPDGVQESARTEFLNRPDGAAMFYDAKDAIGNFCLVIIDREKMANDPRGRSVRMLRFLTPIASNPDYDADDEFYQPKKG